MCKSWRLLAVPALLLPLAFLPACNSTTGTAGGGSGSGPLVAFISNNPENFWSIAEKGTQKAAAEFGVRVEFRRPGTGAADEQRRIIEDLLSKGVKAIAISPNDSANKMAFFKEINERVPLIAVDNDIPDVSARRCYLGTDNVTAGKAVGKLIKQSLPRGGKVMIFVGKLDSQNAIERRLGVVTELAGGEEKCKAQLEQLKANKYPITFGQHEILGTMTDDAKRENCMIKAQDTLAKYPDVNCMVGLWAYNPPAILDAVKSADKIGKVTIIGFDEDEQTLAGIKDGSVAATVVQDPYNFGYESVKIMAGFVKNDPKVLDRPDINGQKQIYIRHRIINKDGKPGSEYQDEKVEAVEPFHAQLLELKK
ncbi:MAG: sugar-binding protein [Gemmataceae bacterium]